MTQAELNKRYENRKKGKKINIIISVPKHIKKLKMLETIADNYKRDNFRKDII